MPHLSRTIRDRDLSDILKRLGPLTNRDLAREASKYPDFSGLTESAIEKAVDRFVKDYVGLGILVRDRGKVEWLPQSRPQERPSPVKNLHPQNAFRQVSQHETVQRFIDGLANGSITFRDKPLQKELRGMKGEIYDELMADIDLYNTFKSTPLISGDLEKRIYETTLKLRAYGFIEEKERPDQ